MAGLRTEVWEREFIKDFYPSSSFLAAAEDKTAFVNNEKINLAESGADPAVLLDNTTFPIPIVEQADGAVEVILRTMSTENTVIRDITQAARRQDLRANAMAAHRRNMQLLHLELAAHSFATAAVDATKGNVIVPASGADRGDGQKAMKFEDLYVIGEVFDEFDIPNEERHFVLDIKHLNDLRKADLKEFKELISEANEGNMSTRFGMRFHKYSRNPWYNVTDDSKLAFGGTPTANHERASFGFVSSQVIRAFGTVKMWLTEKDPQAEGDIFHFSSRFLAIPKRDKFRVSLLSKDVV